MSWTNFDLHSTLISKCTNNGFLKPTMIQSLTLNSFKKFQSFLLSSETVHIFIKGSGKTLAFGLPIINEILKNNPEPINALILAPTRELAIQIKEHLKQVAPKSIRIESFIGGLSKEKQERVLNYPPHIAIATPGRFYELLIEGFLNQLKNLEYLVVDEADKLVEIGAIKDLDKLLLALFKEQKEDLLAKNIPNFNDYKQQNQFFLKGTNKQFSLDFLNELSYDEPIEIDSSNFLKEKKIKVLSKALEENSKNKANLPTNFPGINSNNAKFILVSATLVRIYRGENEKDKSLDLIFKKFPALKNPKIIDLTETEMIPKNLKVFKVVSSEELKFVNLHKLLKEKSSERFIIFLNSINYAKKVCSVLKTLSYHCTLIHSGIKQNQRLKRLDKFKEKKVKILICTDVGARGLDIPLIENVIHFQIPRELESFIHRSGRTARIGNEGTCVMLIGPKDQNNYLFVARNLPKEPENLTIDFDSNDSFLTLFS